MYINSFFFAQAFSGIYDATSTHADEYELQNQTLVDYLKQVPGANRLVGKTHPLNSLSSEMAEAMEPAAQDRKLAMDLFDRVLNKDIRKGDLSGPITGAQVQDMGKWIKETARTNPEYAGLMQDRLTMTVVTDKIFKGGLGNELVRPPIFWHKLMYQKADTRADLFLDELDRLEDMQANALDPRDKERAQKALRATRQITGALGGFDPKTSLAFGFRLKKAAQTRGLRLE